MPQEILTDSDLVQIKQSLKELDDADQLIRQAKAAGIPMDEQERLVKDTRDRLTRIKGAFFPGK